MSLSLFTDYNGQSYYSEIYDGNSNTICKKKTVKLFVVRGYFKKCYRLQGSLAIF